ncbi:MAG TPA: 1,4-dihydroxy-2-naphthoate polyprenyltransferase [Roseiflexaceae bacterium]|nr:1,4-dihydroxy-2-naphthoate polyprenyltransferase [Roseiflexaceae bacterium]
MASEATPALPSRSRAWMMAARPPTLPAAVVPVLVGTAAVARLGFQPLAFVAALLAAVLIQIGTNFANDYFDFRKGADTAERLGPVRVTQSGLIPPETVRSAMVLVFALAALVGLYLVFVGGWPILLIGLLSIAAGVLYTGGPYPLAYHGLGDLFVFIFFGLVAVCGTAYLHVGTVPAVAWFAALPVALIVTAIIVVNNLRDIDTDRLAHKHTLAVLIGRRATRVEYLLLVGGAYLLLLLGPLLGLASAWVLLPWLTLPLAISLVRRLFREQGRVLNRALGGTGRLHMLFGLLFAIGLLL